MRGATVQPHIEFAAGGRILNRGGIITIDWIIVIGADALQHGARVFARKSGEHILQRAFARIGRSRQDILAFDLALEIHGRAPARPGAGEFINARVLNNAVAEVVSHSEISKPDAEPFILRYINFAHKAQALAILLYGNINLVFAGRHDALNHKAIAIIHRHGLAHHPHFMARGNVLAINRNRPAKHADIAEGRAVFAIARGHRILAIGSQWQIAFGMFDRQWPRFIKAPVMVINPQHIGHVGRRIARHDPFGSTLGRNWNHRERRNAGTRCG